MNKRPLGVTIIAVILAISGVLGVISGLETLGITKLGLGSALGGQAQGIAYLVTGLITILVSFGLFTLAKWAWLWAVLVLIGRIVVDAWAIQANGTGSSAGTTAIASIVVNGLIFLYLFKVRSAF